MDAIKFIRKWLPPYLGITEAGKRVKCSMQENYYEFHLHMEWSGTDVILLYKLYPGMNSTHETWSNPFIMDEDGDPKESHYLYLVRNIESEVDLQRAALELYFFLKDKGLLTIPEI